MSAGHERVLLGGRGALSARAADYSQDRAFWGSAHDAERGSGERLTLRAITAGYGRVSNGPDARRAARGCSPRASAGASAWPGGAGQTGRPSRTTETTR